MKILLLEDDELLAESLAEYLEMDGDEVERVAGGEAVFDATFREKYDLYILDINVPDLNGFDVLEALNEAGDDTPAIYISALTDIASIARGFEIGAVDYLKKPFDPEELRLRIRRIFREREKEGTVEYGAIRFDPVSGRVEGVDEAPFYLGEVQRRLFALLLQRRGGLVSSEELMEALEHPSPNALRVTMAKLKKRLGIAITNVRGRGYILETV
ncbi:response regulator transcription factor [Nitratifractor sp.]|uniref:response regulator transcription factor n=1 Tax=Nitratifractor sp. TaxID=2268144 RepID=UPI0025FF4061|nr:response regulator transcription factor [Nitratifractor sp.]